MIEIVLEGPLDTARLTTHLEALETEPLGTARPWLALAELLPVTFVQPAGSDALGAYRNTLIATFTNVAALPSEEFHRVLAPCATSGRRCAERSKRPPSPPKCLRAERPRRETR